MMYFMIFIIHQCFNIYNYIRLFKLLYLSILRGNSGVMSIWLYSSAPPKLFPGSVPARTTPCSPSLPAEEALGAPAHQPLSRRSSSLRTLQPAGLATAKGHDRALSLLLDPYSTPSCVDSASSLWPAHAPPPPCCSPLRPQ
jgi:hypothetical protein